MSMPRVVYKIIRHPLAVAGFFILSLILAYAATLPPVVVPSRVFPVTAPPRPQDGFCVRGSACSIPFQDVTAPIAPTAASPSSSRFAEIPFGILMYHHIDAQAARPRQIRYTVTPANLERQIRFLQNEGYSFLALKDVFEHASTTGSLPNRTLVLTFDDGYRSFYTNVFPLLKKYRVPATLFVINQDIGKNGNVTWAMMKEMIASGLVEIGAHTVNHKQLTKITLSEVRFQLEESKKDLEKKLGITVVSLAYPFGSFNAAVIDAAREAGFTGAVSIYSGKKPGITHLYDWRRVQIQNKDQEERLIKLLYGAFVVVK